MFIYKKHIENENDKPIKVWLSSIDDIEQKCLQQAINIAKLPFIHSHVALMPDTHTGYGMPIGGVVATKDIISPNMVGVDIGCGMCFVQTNIPVSLLKETMTSNGTLLQNIIGTILRNIPTGFSHHKLPQPSFSLDRFKAEVEEKSAYRMAFDFAKDLQGEIENGYYQIGTLGGGNHFIELQEDENGMTAIMLHSGSRNFGYKICKYFNNVAKELNKDQIEEKDLAYLSLESNEGSAYKVWMDLALDFAMENRNKMMLKTKEIFYNLVKKHTDFNHLSETMEVNAHHNYAAMEKHFDEDVIVHRKGAIKVSFGELGIIPGAMGSYSYIVEGLGNKDSFESCSHGAGRKMSRTSALEKFSTQFVIEELNADGVVLGKTRKKDVGEECKGAYKDIDFVIGQELDLVKPIKKLKTIGVVKG